MIDDRYKYRYIYVVVADRLEIRGIYANGHTTK